MAESLENLDNILTSQYWAKDKGHNSLAEALNRFARRGKIKLFLLKKIIQKKVLEPSLSRQSSETKSNTKLVLVLKPKIIDMSRILTNPKNKNVSEINLFKN